MLDVVTEVDEDGEGASEWYGSERLVDRLVLTRADGTPIDLGEVSPSTVAMADGVGGAWWGAEGSRAQEEQDPATLHHVTSDGVRSKVVLDAAAGVTADDLGALPTIVTSDGSDGAVLVHWGDDEKIVRVGLDGSVSAAGVGGHQPLVRGPARFAWDDGVLVGSLDPDVDPTAWAGQAGNAGVSTVARTLAARGAPDLSEVVLPREVFLGPSGRPLLADSGYLIELTAPGRARVVADGLPRTAVEGQVVDGRLLLVTATEVFEVTEGAS